MRLDVGAVLPLVAPHADIMAEGGAHLGPQWDEQGGKNETEEKPLRHRYPPFVSRQARGRWRVGDHELVKGYVPYTTLIAGRTRATSPSRP
jgi:hypothetical protein